MDLALSLAYAMMPLGERLENNPSISLSIVAKHTVQVDCSEACVIVHWPKLNFKTKDKPVQHRQDNVPWEESPITTRGERRQPMILLFITDLEKGLWFHFVLPLNYEWCSSSSPHSQLHRSPVVRQWWRAKNSAFEKQGTTRCIAMSLSPNVCCCNSSDNYSSPFGIMVVVWVNCLTAKLMSRVCSGS